MTSREDTANSHNQRKVVELTVTIAVLIASLGINVLSAIAQTDAEENFAIFKA